MNSNHDQRNLLFAVILSFAVLLGWQYFFAAPRLQDEQARQEFSKQVDAQRSGAEVQGLPGVGTSPITPPSASSPAAGAQPATMTVTREEALRLSPRVPIRTPSLEGSIALKSGRIDDLVLIKYRETVEPSSPHVTLLSPTGSPAPYFAEYGWVPQGGTDTKVPDRETLWAVESGDTLTPEKPVTLTWDNGQGLVFRRTVTVDKDYMFKIVDEVENKTAADVALLPYARVHRYGHPPSHAYYILHEGLIGVSGSEGLQEVTYSSAVSSGTPKVI
jgi:YidC/Oxa1 family membrane protein insertase